MLQSSRLWGNALVRKSKKLGDIDFALMSACEIWEQFNSIMQEAITVYVPQRVVSRHHKPLWMTTNVIRSVKKKT